MNPETITAGLQLASAALSFLRQLNSDPNALQAVVDKARAEGREVDLADVRASIDRTTQEAAALDALIASKRT